MSERERALYPLVEKYLKDQLGCFITGQDRGTVLGRVDVIGVRDIGGDLSGGFELIGVEVKTGSQQFVKAAGQAYGYSVYCDKCYLAAIKSNKEPFSPQERDIAAKLGVGLLSITGRRVLEVLAAPPLKPIERLRLQVIERTGYSPCVLCNSLFRRGEDENWWANISKSGLKEAAAREVGYIFWLYELAGRGPKNRNETYERRYLCKDCVFALVQGR